MQIISDLTALLCIPLVLCLRGDTTIVGRINRSCYLSLLVIDCRTVRVYEAAWGRQSNRAWKRHLRVLRQSQEDPDHVVRRRSRGGSRSQVSGSHGRVYSPTRDQRGKAGRRGRGEGGLPRSDFYRQTLRRT